MIEYLSIMLNARRAKMDERGASAVEYGLLIAGIAAVIVVVVLVLGGKIQDAFSDTCDAIGSTADGNGGVTSGTECQTS